MGGIIARSLLLHAPQLLPPEAIDTFVTIASPMGSARQPTLPTPTVLPVVTP